MPSDQLNDQELQFKKRARRRLVGAIALVLLMITILPMVLDDRSAKTPGQEIAITIPSQEGGEFTSKVIPVPAQGLPQDTQKAPPSVEAELPPPPAQIQPAPVQLENPIKPSAPTQAVTESQVADPVKPEVKPVAVPKPAEPLKSASQPAVKAVEAKLAEPKIADAEVKKDNKVSGANANGLYSVQIGVFSDIENVKKLQQKLSGKSLKSYTEKLDTPKGEKIRLRVGPFKSRSEAEAAALKVKELDLAAMVVSNK